MFMHSLCLFFFFFPFLPILRLPSVFILCGNQLSIFTTKKNLHIIT
ncbi:hypothetical protein N040_22145 [Serratia marcescens EGD-HP20]|nr:hypothetical protein N040_22145 [Serratia marcescens EGD-HP20]